MEQRDCAPYSPYMQMMNLPCQSYPMMTMPAQQLESMYPKTYFVIYPVVSEMCDMMDMKYGTTYCPRKEELDKAIEEIVVRVEPQIEVIVRDNPGEMEEARQFGFYGRRFLRDLAGILLIRELLGRRRPFYGYPFYYGYPGFYGGYDYPGYYGPGFGGYGIY